MCIDSGELPVYCTLSCDEGFAFAFQPMSDYFCPINQTILADYYDENFMEDEMMDAADYVELIMAGRVCLRIDSFSTLHIGETLFERLKTFTAFTLWLKT